jgi:hypothetical protein
VRGFAVEVRAVVIAAALVAAAGLLRWDFGVFGLVALLLTIAWTKTIRVAGDAAATQLALRATATFGVVMGAVYVPLIFLASDPARWLREVLFYQLVEFPKWRTTLFVGPSLEQLMRASAAGDVYEIFHGLLLVLYLPLPMLAAAAAGVCLWKQRPAAGGHQQDAADQSTAERSASVAYLVLTTVLLLNQMRVRTGLTQGFPAVIASLPLAALGVTRLWNEWKAARSAMAVLGFAIAAALFTNTLRSALKPLRTHAPAAIMRATGVTIDMDNYQSMLLYIREHSGAHDPIYSGAIDHSKLFIADSLVYFLAEREPADPFMELEPGIANTEDGQKAIRDALEAKHVPLVVLSDLSHAEPNLTAVSNGVHLLDEYLAATYREVKRFGNYRVYLRNPGP